MTEEKQIEAIVNSVAYDRDFVAWTQHTAELLRQHRFNELDLEHLADEIESLGRSDRRALESRLEVPARQALRELAPDDHRTTHTYCAFDRRITKLAGRCSNQR